MFVVAECDNDCLSKVAGEHAIIKTTCSFTNPCKTASVVYDKVVVRSSKKGGGGVFGLGGGGGSWWKTVLVGVVLLAALFGVAFVAKKQLYEKICGGYNNHRRGGWHSRNSRGLGLGSATPPPGGGIAGRRNLDTFSPFSIGGGDDEGVGMEVSASVGYISSLRIDYYLTQNYKFAFSQDGKSIELSNMGNDNLFFGKGGDNDTRGDGVTKEEEEFDGAVERGGYVPPVSPGHGGGGGNMNIVAKKEEFSI